MISAFPKNNATIPPTIHAIFLKELNFQQMTSSHPVPIVKIKTDAAAVANF